MIIFIACKYFISCFICIYRSMYPLQAINLNMLQVLGRTDIFLYVEIVKKIILLGPLFVGAFIDIYWMLIASIGTSIVAFFLNSYYTGKSLGYTSWMQLKDIAPSYGVGITVGLSVYFLKFLPFSCWVILPIQFFTGCLVFFILCHTYNYQEYIELKNIVTKSIKNYF